MHDLFLNWQDNQESTRLHGLMIGQQLFLSAIVPIVGSGSLRSWDYSSFIQEAFEIARLAFACGSWGFLKFSLVEVTYQLVLKNIEP